MALDGLREIVEAEGGSMFDRQVRRETDIMNDDDLRRIAACVEPMRQAGLLDPNKQIKDLAIGTGYAQRLWDARGYNGLNKQAVNALATDDAERIETVPELLALTHCNKRNIGDKKMALLRQALIASGMPEEFPWPWDYTMDEPDKLLRGLALITPSFEELPNIVKREVAPLFGIVPTYTPEEAPGLSDSQLERCAVLYAERRREILAIVGWEE